MRNNRTVYVAGASAEVERAERIIQALRSAGFIVTHDWTRSVREYRAKGYRDADLSDEACEEIAASDLDAVRRADVLLFLSPEQPTTGAWVELGAASNYGDKTILVSGASARRYLFTRIADWIFDDDEAALVALLNLEAA
jgi:hypothetical protein